MIISNVRDEPFYIEDVIRLLMMRDKELFVDKFYNEEEYKHMVEALYLLFQDVEVPKEDLYHIVKQIINSLYNLHHDTEYKHYEKCELHNGTSPKKQIERDIKTHIKPYEDFLKKMYREFIYHIDGNEVLINAPKEAKEYFTLLNRLKDNMKKDGSFENKQYYKPKKPTKKSIIELFKEIEAHYKIKFNPENLKKLKL